jgi:hypothetical protein
MSSELLFSLLSSVGLLLIGVMAKTSSGQGWQPVKKYWIYFVIVGGLSLLYTTYKYFLK